jgi:putative DNA primase/helicase
MSGNEIDISTSKVDAYNEKNKAVDDDYSSVVFYTADGRLGIRHKNGALPEILDGIEMALAGANLDVFVYAGRLVKVYKAETKITGITRPDGAIVIHTIESSFLTELLGRAAIHVKFDSRVTDKETGKKGAYVPCNCPRAVAEALLARGYWPKLPELTGFVECPTIDKTGRLIDKVGYDIKSGLYLVFDEALSKSYIPSRLNKKLNKNDALVAAKQLRGIFQEFPFVAKEDESATMSAIMTAAIRRILPSSPLFGITAPMPGTGKTILAETASIVVTGRRPSVLSLGYDDAEAEKRIGGVLLAGDAAILFDNLERPLGGDLLCQITTQPSVRIRPLGVSSVISVPTHSLLMATGNNLSVVGDLKRRVVLIRLDAKTERPEQRTFSKNHLDEVLANRTELITAVLILIMAYIQAGEPIIEGHKPYGSFEQWDRLVRKPLMWIGYPDPLAGAEALRDSDPDTECMRAMFSAWLATPSLDKASTASDVVKIGMEYLPGGAEPACPELRDALQIVCAEKVNGRRLGYWLRNHKDRIVDGMQLVKHGEDSHTKVATWKVLNLNR